MLIDKVLLLLILAEAGQWSVEMDDLFARLSP